MTNRIQVVDGALVICASGVETMGLEPTTSCLQSRRSAGLSYVPVGTNDKPRNLVYPLVPGFCAASTRPGRKKPDGISARNGSEATNYNPMLHEGP